MATLSSPGVGSGLDVNSIVSQLMAAERQPLTLLTERQTSFKADISAYGQLQGMLSGIETAAKNLVSAGATPAYSAASGNASIFTATASSSAVPGSYAIKVNQLAQSQKLVAAGVADDTAAIGGGGTTTLTLDFGTVSGGSFDSVSGTYSGASFTANAAKVPVNITIDNTSNTLQGIRDAINAAKAGVTAAIVNDGSGSPYRLVLTATDSGAANSMRIAVSGDSALQDLLAQDPAGTQKLAQYQAARNAEFTVDGLAITKPSNTVGDAIAGVTLTLAGESGVTATTLTVQQDSSKVGSALNALVTAYNNVNKSLGSLLGEDGILQGDATTQTIQRQLRALTGNAVNPGGLYQSLASVYVTQQKDGTLAIDSTKLNAALADNYADVAELVEAFGNALTTLTDNILDPASGQIFNATDALNRQIKYNIAQQDSMNLRLAAIEASYRAQFSALDAMMTSMTQTAQFLQQQFYNISDSSNG